MYLIFFNYIINASLQRDWCTILFDCKVLQYSALWLALRYYTTNDSIAQEVALSTLKASLSENDFNIYIKEIRSCTNIMEEEMVNTIKIVIDKGNG